MGIKINKTVSYTGNITIKQVQNHVEALAQERYKHISKIDHIYPQAEIYVVESANENGTYNVVKESMKTLINSSSKPPGFDDLGNGLYEDPGAATDVIHRINSVTSILPSTPLTQGDKVEIGFYNRNRQKPYIRRLLSRGIFNQPAPSVDEFPTLPLEPGMWIQSGAFWFNNKTNHLQNINRFDIRVPSHEEVIGQALVVQEIDHDTILIHFPEMVDLEEEGQLFLDGFEYGDPWPPVDELLFAVTIGPEPSLGINQTHTAFFLERIYNESEVWTANYKRPLNFNQSQIHNLSGYDPNAGASSLNFLGLVAFPSNGQQTITSLHPIYEPVYNEEPIIERSLFSASGSEPSEIIDGIFIVPPGDVVDPPNYSIMNIDLTSIPDGMNYPDFILESGGNLLALMAPALGLIDVYYFRENGSGDGYENFVADGVGNTFEIFSGYQGPWDGGSIGEIMKPNRAITALTEVSVGGNPDPLATFDGAIVTLSFVPDVGTTVDIGYSYIDLEHQFDQVHENIFNYAEYAGGLSYVPIEIINVDFEGSSSMQNTYTLPGVPYIYFPAYFSFEDYIEIEYDALIGDLETLVNYDITALRLVETEGGSTVTLDIPMEFPFNANPITPEKDEGVPNYNFINLPHTQLFYDSFIDGYTVAGPEGLTWRSRLALEATPASPPSPAAIYNTTPWPTEEVSINQPEEWAGDPITKRRFPWLGLSVCGSRAIQGGWPRVSDDPELPGYLDSEDSFKIRLWKRDLDSYIWEVSAEVNLRDLIETTSTDPVVIDAQNSLYGGGGFGPFGPHSFITPMAKDQSAWILALRWRCVPEEEYFYGLRTKYGYSDAGLTFIALHPTTGVVLNRFTIKASKTEVILRDVDPTENRENVSGDRSAVDIAIDKYVNDNPIYWPPTSGPEPAPPYLGGIMWAAQENRFANYTDAGSPWFIISYISAMSEMEVTKEYPEAPNLANHYNGDFKRYNNFTMDADGNIYFALQLPVWLRLQDSYVTDPFIPEEIIGTTVTDEFFITTGSNVTPPVTGYISIWIKDPSEAIRFAASVSRVTRNGVDQSVIYPSTFTGIAELLRRVFVNYPTAVYDSDNGNGTYNWRVPSATFVTYALVPKLNPDFGTALTETYPGAGPFEFPTFSGFQGSPMSTQGLQVYTSQARYGETYSVTSRNILVKLNWNGEAFTQIWSKDISYTGNYESPSSDFPQTDDQIGGPEILDVLKVGRVIFVLERKHTVIPFVYNTPRKLYVSIYEDGPGEPILRHSLELDETVSPNTSTIRKTFGGINSEDKEYFTVWYHVGGSVNKVFVTNVECRTNLEDLPLHETLDNIAGMTTQNGGVFPDRTEQLNNMLNVAGGYFWLNLGVFPLVRYKPAIIDGE